METATMPARDTHFRNYNDDQGKNYAQRRMDYHSSVYETVLNHHRSTWGQFDLVLDVGCGPGLATNSLAKHFKHATGADPSEGMLSTARARDLVTKSSEPVQFIKAAAEDLHDVTSESVDLITASNAAHWIEMREFWPEAARVLKPNGSVAFWTSGEIVPHPDMPQAERIRAALLKNREEYLEPFTTDGSRLVRDGYRSLPMPWDLQPPVTAFARDGLFRKDWVIGEKFHGGPDTVDLDTFEAMMGTGSAVAKWREANPDKTGTEADVIKRLRREVEGLLHEAGVPKGKEVLYGHAPGVVLMVKKSG